MSAALAGTALAVPGPHHGGQPWSWSTSAGGLEFLPADCSRTVRSGRETTKSTSDGISYGATGLEPVYFEGALARALRQPVEAVPAAAPAAVGRRIARIEVESVDPQLPLRVMATRTLVRGFRRRIQDTGTIVYEGPTRAGGDAFLVQFGTDNAAAIVANVLWTELRDAAGVSVEGRRVANNHAALKDALLAVTAERLAG